MTRPLAVLALAAAVAGIFARRWFYLLTHPDRLLAWALRKLHAR